MIGNIAKERRLAWLIGKDGVGADDQDVDENGSCPFIAKESVGDFENDMSTAH